MSQTEKIQKINQLQAEINLLRVELENEQLLNSKNTFPGYPGDDCEEREKRFEVREKKTLQLIEVATSYLEQSEKLVKAMNELTEKFMPAIIKKMTADIDG